MLDKARESMEAGATGLIFGRNVWQREYAESLRFAARLQVGSTAVVRDMFERFARSMARGR